MCGIAGFATSNRNEYTEGLVQSMLPALALRGPDSEGLHSWPGVTLGHRRLAILDLSEAGAQPMVSKQSGLGVVFNGCIYNFQELRSELEGHGHRFHSNTDTEVLLHGYEQWGADALVRRLRGMFAFAIWDNPRRKLTLVRDRLGVKPLLYRMQEGSIAFASTVTALRSADLAGKIDPQAMLEILEFGYVTDGSSIYAGIQKLPPATLLEWQDGRTVQRSYWSLPEPDESSRVTFGEAVEETERLLIESVKLRLYADVPIGALLSGGVDSTLVCWGMRKLNANIKAFTVSTEGDPFDESGDASATARRLGIPHEIVTLPREESDLLSELTDAYGEPFPCSSALAMMRVSKAVKPMATVLLTGDGGDDIFLGYPDHLNFWRAQKLANTLPDAAADFWRKIRPLIEKAPALRRPKHFLDYATGGLGAVTNAHDGLPYYERRGMLGDRLADAKLGQRAIPLSLASGRRLVPDVLAYDTKTRFTGEFLTKVDGGTMFHGLEARSPFLDQRIWDFAATLPISVRLQGSVLKAILREIVRKNVGEDVAARKKQGFTIPVERWLGNRWRGALETLASDNVLERNGWLKPGSVRLAIDEGSGRGRVPTQLWHLLVLDRWLKKEGTRDEPRPATRLVPEPAIVTGIPA